MGEALGDAVAHRISRYKHNRIEQDHRAVKQRYYPTRGFGSVASAARFCAGFEAPRRCFRAQARSDERVSLAERRRRLPDRWATILSRLTTGEARFGLPPRPSASPVFPLPTQPPAAPRGPRPSCR